MSAHKIIIAIDGYSSCGKSTLAKELAVLLGYNYIDSGAMYRAITLYFLRNRVNYADHAEVPDAIASINLAFVFNERAQRSDIHLNDEDVEPYIRDMIVSEKVSEVAAIREVRSFAVAQQKHMGQAFMDGVKRNTSMADRAKLLDQFLKFGQLFSTVPELKKGDVISMEWTPNVGTNMYINGKKIGETFLDVAFFNAVLKIWLGDNPVDSSLKNKLLGVASDKR